MAKKFSADYTIDDITTLYETRSADGDEARLRDMADQIRAMVRLQHEVNVPDTYRAVTKDVRVPFMRDNMLRIASSLVGKRPVTHITPRNELDKGQREMANIAERWDAGLFERINKETGKDIDFENAVALVRDGDAITKVVHRPDAWANFPTRASNDGGYTEDAGSYNKRVDNYARGANLPIAVRNIDRLCVVREGGEYGDEWIIEYGEYTKKHLISRYDMKEVEGRLVNPRKLLEGRPMAKGLKTSTAGRCVKVEFFNEYEWHVIIDGVYAPGFPKANPYAPYLPYFSASAFDMESLLYSLVYLIPRLDEALTMKQTWGQLGAWPNPVITSMPNGQGLPGYDLPVGAVGEAGQGEAGAQALQWKPGEAMNIPLGKTVSFLMPPPVGKDLNDMIMMLKGLIDVAGIPSIMRGSASGDTSGYMGNQMLNAAQMAYQLATISLKRQREKTVDFIHWLVPNKVKQTVYVVGYSEINKTTGKPKKTAKEQWVGLGKAEDGKKLPENVADVDMLGPSTCTYRPTLPTDQQANAMIALQLTNSPKPLYDRRHALENIMQEEDADGILDAIWVEEGLNAEPVRSRMIEAAMQKAKLLTVKPNNPAQQLVGPNGQPLIGAENGTPYVGSVPNASNVPMQGQIPPGGPIVQGLNNPIVPGNPTPSGVPGRPGGRPAGAYPGRPGGA